jgi:Ca-activated chloride channel family protein
MVSWGQSTDFTVRIEVPVVSVDVSVTDADGQPVDGLEADDFELLEDGNPQPIRYFGTTAAPYHVYLLLDRSASTNDQRPLMLEVVTDFIGNIRNQDRVAVGVFGDEAETLVDWDDSRSAALTHMREWAERSSEGGTTEFYRSLERVLERGFNGIDERRAIIVLTDGRDISLYQELQQNGRLLLQEDDRMFQEVYEAAGEAGIAVYFIATNTDVNLDPASPGNEYRSLERLYPRTDAAARYLDQVRLRMEAIAHVSGGEVLFPGDARDVSPLFERIADRFGQAYSLGWEPRRTTDSPGPDSAGARTIEVRLESPDYRIQQSRTEYLSR